MKRYAKWLGNLGVLVALAAGLCTAGGTAGHNGLRMKGPAAADYILASYPGLV